MPHMWIVLLILQSSGFESGCSNPELRRIWWKFESLQKQIQCFFSMTRPPLFQVLLEHSGSRFRVHSDNLFSLPRQSHSLLPTSWERRESDIGGREWRWSKWTECTPTNPKRVPEGCKRSQKKGGLVVEKKDGISLWSLSSLSSNAQRSILFIELGIVFTAQRALWELNHLILNLKNWSGVVHNLWTTPNCLWFKKPLSMTV
jgi:hypothetical protein